MTAAPNSLERRAPRLDLNFPVTFCHPCGAVRGRCLNLSESGLLASFGEELELRAEGELRISTGVLCYAQRVRVARVDAHQASFAFVFAHNMERQAVRELLAVAQETPWLIGALPS